jgi:hypothetical protein
MFVEEGGNGHRPETEQAKLPALQLNGDHGPEWRAVNPPCLTIETTPLFFVCVCVCLCVFVCVCVCVCVDKKLFRSEETEAMFPFGVALEKILLFFVFEPQTRK